MDDEELKNMWMTEHNEPTARRIIVLLKKVI